MRHLLQLLGVKGTLKLLRIKSNNQMKNAAQICLILQQMSFNILFEYKLQFQIIFCLFCCKTDSIKHDSNKGILRRLSQDN